MWSQLTLNKRTLTINLNKKALKEIYHSNRATLYYQMVKRLS